MGSGSVLAMPMQMLPLHCAFPERAKADARALLVRWPHGGLPVDDFVLVEHLCATPGCDCRRVVLGVVRASTRAHVATLVHAFDPPPVGTTTLDDRSPQSDLAKDLLSFFVETCASDPRYVALLEEHYRLWRLAVEEPSDPAHARILATAAAPATAEGSGKPARPAARAPARVPYPPPAHLRRFTRPH